MELTSKNSNNNLELISNNSSASIIAWVKTWMAKLGNTDSSSTEHRMGKVIALLS